MIKINTLENNINVLGDNQRNWTIDFPSIKIQYTNHNSYTCVHKIVHTRTIT